MSKKTVTEEIKTPTAEIPVVDVDFETVRQEINPESMDYPLKKKRAKRARKKVEAEKPEIDVAKEDLLPFFTTLNMVMEATKIRPLSEQDIATGIEAWFPIYKKYAPLIAEKAIWLPPIIWTTGMIISRKDQFKFGKKATELNVEIPKAQEPIESV